MNCKQGDLAIVMSGASSGVVVICVAPYCGPWRDSSYQLGWEIDRPLLKSSGKREKYFADRHLRPIRDTPGEDETLQWLDVPTTEKASA